MRTLGIININPTIKTQITKVFETRGPSSYKLCFLEATEDVIEFINYELPELVIINFSDPEIEIDKIINHITQNTWLLSFGIIGLYSQDIVEEDELLTRLKSLNVLTLLEYCRIQSHIFKSVEVILKNHQVIFQQDFTKNFFQEASGSFAIENDILAIPLFAGIGATLLFQRGLINSEKKARLHLAIAELIINGVEHGNCGITYEEKTAALDQGKSVVEMVQERCRNPEIAMKRVHLDWEIQRNQSLFTIRDEGKGFDVALHLEKTRTQDKLSSHGRGIRMALLLDKNLYYNDKGNEVTLAVPHTLQLNQAVPEGFSREQVLQVKKGDIIFREGEEGDFLYYIASGLFSVFHKAKLVGLLSVKDIFVGEMSFLLNQKRSATVRAETPGRLVRLSRKAFVMVLQEYPHYGIFLSKLLARRLALYNERWAARAKKS